MGRRNKKTPEERQQKAAKWAERLDPGTANRQAGALDAAGGTTGQIREAQRDWEAVKVMDSLLAEQQETNRLLRELLDRQAGA